MGLRRIGSIVVLAAGLAGAACASVSTSPVHSHSFVSVSSEPASSPGSGGPMTSPEKISSATPTTRPVAPKPQVYVAAAQLLNTDDGAIVVKDCPAQGSCRFRADVTSDGGATWRRGGDLAVADVTDNGSPSAADPIIGLAMVSSADMFAFGSSVWHSTDAGATWTQLPDAPAVDTMASSNGEVWAGVACADVSRCASSIDVISAGHLVRLPHQPGGLVGSIVRDGADAYAVMRGVDGAGRLEVSRDDGATWQQRILPQNYCSYSLGPNPGAISTTGVVYLICATGASAGSEPKDLFVSYDGAASWQHQTTLETYGYADSIVVASPNLLWRYGGRAPIFRSTDAGRSWQVALDDLVGDAAGPMTQAFAAAGSHALVFAFSLPPSPSFDGPWTINEYVTTDAGASWQTRPLHP